MAEQIGERSTQSVGSAQAPDWRVWLWWVLASMVGWAVGGYVGVALGGGLSRGIIVAGYVGVALGGIATAVLQWLVLRQRVSRAGWWVVTGIAGGAVVGVLVVGVGWVVGVGGSAVGGPDWGANWGPDWSANPGKDVGWVAGAGLYGAVVGGLQWLVLRRRVARAGWWVLASTVGWVVGGLVSGITDTAAGWAVLGAVYGAITGAALVWLLRRPAAGTAAVAAAA